MRQELADLVYPVFSYGLDLKRRLESGVRPDLSHEQKYLRGLLAPFGRPRTYDFDGEEAPRVQNLPAILAADQWDDLPFLGVRYALVCWLDELFSQDASWGTLWDDRSLEGQVYELHVRAELFWKQAQVAMTWGEASRRSDVLEAFYLCVALGFRGAHHDDLGAMREWVTNALPLLANIPQPVKQDDSYPLPQSSVPTAPRRGRAWLRGTVFAGGVLLSFLLGLAAYLGLILLRR